MYLLSHFSSPPSSGLTNQQSSCQGYVLNITYSKGLAAPLHSHKRLFSSVNQDVSAQMVVSDEGLATALIVTNKRPLQKEREREENIYTFMYCVCVSGASAPLNTCGGPRTTFRSQVLSFLLPCGVQESNQGPQI